MTVEHERDRIKRRPRSRPGHAKPNLSEIMTSTLYIVPALIQILLIFGGLLFALAWIRKFPKPATWLAAGLGVILCERIGGSIGTVMLARTTTPQNFGFYGSILSMLLIFIGTSGLAMMVVAVFVSRSAARPDELLNCDHGTSGMDLPPAKDSNPYSTPSSGW